MNDTQKCVMLSHLTWSRLIFYKKHYVIRTDTPLGSDTPPTKDANDNLIHKNVLRIQNHQKFMQYCLSHFNPFLRDIYVSKLTFLNLVYILNFWIYFVSKMQQLR